MLFSLQLERALRFAAQAHAHQTRKGSRVPYVEHLFGVAMVLDRLGFDEEVVIAGLLHDAVEDAGVSLEDIESRFGPRVKELVNHCTEVKHDAQKAIRPWIDRKTDHMQQVADAPNEAKAVILADKLHNLSAIAVDLKDGVNIWSLFNAERDQVLGYYASMIEICDQGGPKLARLAAECRVILEKIAYGTPVVDKS